MINNIVTLLLTLKILFILPTSFLNVSAFHFLKMEKDLIFLLPKISLLMNFESNLTIATEFVNTF